MLGISHTIKAGILKGRVYVYVLLIKVRHIEVPLNIVSIGRSVKSDGISFGCVDTTHWLAEMSREKFNHWKSGIRVNFHFIITWLSHIMEEWLDGRTQQSRSDKEKHIFKWHGPFSLKLKQILMFRFIPDVHKEKMY